jgi:uncharacterized protein YcbX
MPSLNTGRSRLFPLPADHGFGSQPGVTGRIAILCRHPVKGFTPERLDQVRLAPDAPFPFDRIFAVENGDSGFDPDHPVHISKTRFAVLARMAKVASARTAFDDASGVLNASAPGQPDFRDSMLTPDGRAAFADWLGDLLGPEAEGPLRVIAAPASHRFLDHPQGQVSVINLASVRDLGDRIGHPINPLRFRANIYVEGWPAWAENGWTGRGLVLGKARARVFKPIVRCAATGVDPQTALRDLDPVKALFDHLGHLWCGVYVHVTTAGAVSAGDVAAVVALET